MVFLEPCTSPQTCSVPGGNGSLPPSCTGQGRPSRCATWPRWYLCGPRCPDRQVDAVVHGVVRETLSVEIAVCTPAVNYDCWAWFDPVMYDGCQCVGSSVRYRNKKCSTGACSTPPNTHLPLIGCPYGTFLDRTCSRQSQRSC